MELRAETQDISARIFTKIEIKFIICIIFKARTRNSE